MTKVKTPKEFLANKKTSRPKSFTTKELVWLIIGILIALNALVFLIIGLITDYADLGYDIFEPVNTSMKSVLGGIDFKWFGVITFVLGTLVCALSLSSSSRNEDREKEKEARREQRLKAMQEAQNQGIVVDFTGTTSANDQK